MATPYEDIFDKFYKSKLVNYKEFFDYKNLTNIETEELVKEHSLSLMNKAISTIYVYGVPQIDLYDKDDMMEQFNNELNNMEINIIIDGMYYNLMCESRNKLQILGLTFKSSELSLFSPSAERLAYEKTLETLRNDLEFSIQNYLNRERSTWKLKTIK